MPPIPKTRLQHLPEEARETLGNIASGRPFPNPRDGVVFLTREARLPEREPGYYREYTVSSPDAVGRGARRISTARNGETCYTDDHYRSFRDVIE